MNKKYSSKREEEYVKNLTNTPLNKCKEEMKKRISFQTIDQETGMRCFNISANNVEIVDDNGEVMIINNTKQAKEILSKNNGDKNINENDKTIDEENDIEEDIEFE